MSRLFLRVRERVAHDELTHPTGLETWFTLPRRETIKPPPRWKMPLVFVGRALTARRVLSGVAHATVQGLAASSPLSRIPAYPAHADDLRCYAERDALAQGMALPDDATPTPGMSLPLSPHGTGSGGRDARDRTAACGYRSTQPDRAAVREELAALWQAIPFRHGA